MKTEKVCPICGSSVVEKKIQYIDQNEGHFLIVEDVPVEECTENGHQFFHASVAKKIEQLFDLERQRALIPKSTIAVPVVELGMAG